MVIIKILREHVPKILKKDWFECCVEEESLTKFEKHFVMTFMRVSVVKSLAGWRISNLVLFIIMVSFFIFMNPNIWAKSPTKF